jgi:hypothetical protein
VLSESSTQSMAWMSDIPDFFFFFLSLSLLTLASVTLDSLVTSLVEPHFP